MFIMIDYFWYSQEKPPYTLDLFFTYFPTQHAAVHLLDHVYYNLFKRCDFIIESKANVGSGVLRISLKLRSWDSAVSKKIKGTFALFGLEEPDISTEQERILVELLEKIEFLQNPLYQMLQFRAGSPETLSDKILSASSLGRKELITSLRQLFDHSGVLVAGLPENSAQEQMLGFLANQQIEKPLLAPDFSLPPLIQEKDSRKLGFVQIIRAVEATNILDAIKAEFLMTVFHALLQKKLVDEGGLTYKAAADFFKDYGHRMFIGFELFARKEKITDVLARVEEIFDTTINSKTAEKAFAVKKASLLKKIRETSDNDYLLNIDKAWQFLEWGSNNYLIPQKQRKFVADFDLSSLEEFRLRKMSALQSILQTI